MTAQRRSQCRNDRPLHPADRAKTPVPVEVVGRRKQPCGAVCLLTPGQLELLGDAIVTKGAALGLQPPPQALRDRGRWRGSWQAGPSRATSNRWHAHRQRPHRDASGCPPVPKIPTKALPFEGGCRHRQIARRHPFPSVELWMRGREIDIALRAGETHQEPTLALPWAIVARHSGEHLGRQVISQPSSAFGQKRPALRDALPRCPPTSIPQRHATGTKNSRCGNRNRSHQPRGVGRGTPSRSTLRNPFLNRFQAACRTCAGRRCKMSMPPFAASRSPSASAHRGDL
jgi:hypothetical protein